MGSASSVVVVASPGWSVAARPCGLLPVRMTSEVRSPPVAETIPKVASLSRCVSLSMCVVK